MSRKIDILHTTRLIFTGVKKCEIWPRFSTLVEFEAVWFLRRDTELIEQVQRRFTKRLNGLSDYSYDERLKLLNLDSLQCRRI